MDKEEGPCYHCSQMTERHCLFGTTGGGKWIYVCSPECDRIMARLHNTRVRAIRDRSDHFYSDLYNTADHWPDLEPCDYFDL